MKKKSRCCRDLSIFHLCTSLLYLRPHYGGLDLAQSIKDSRCSVVCSENKTQAAYKESSCSPSNLQQLARMKQSLMLKKTALLLSVVPLLSTRKVRMIE